MGFLDVCLSVYLRTVVRSSLTMIDLYHNIDVVVQQENRSVTFRATHCSSSREWWCSLMLIRYEIMIVSRKKTTRFRSSQRVDVDTHWRLSLARRESNLTDRRWRLRIISLSSQSLLDQPPTDDSHRRDKSIFFCSFGSWSTNTTTTIYSL
jgi:hypothetical protein